MRCFLFIMSDDFQYGFHMENIYAHYICDVNMWIGSEMLIIFIFLIENVIDF